MQWEWDSWETVHAVVFVWIVLALFINLFGEFLCSLLAKYDWLREPLERIQHLLAVCLTFAVTVVIGFFVIAGVIFALGGIIGLLSIGWRQL